MLMRDRPAIADEIAGLLSTRIAFRGRRPPRRDVCQWEGDQAVAGPHQAIVRPVSGLRGRR